MLMEGVVLVGGGGAVTLTFPGDNVSLTKEALEVLVSLSRRVDEKSGLTVRGEIIGTSFMFLVRKF